MKPSDSLKRLAMLLVLAALAGCHTIEGVGRDIESAGDSIQDTAQDCTDDVKGNC